MMPGKTDGSLMRSNVHSIGGSRISIPIGIGILLGCVFALCCPHVFFASSYPSPIYPSPIQDRQISKTNLQLELVSVTDKNTILKKQVRKLTEKLRLSEKREFQAQKQVLALGNPQKAGPFGTVKCLRTNPTVVADTSVNPRLAKLLEKVSLRNELIVALANSKVKDILAVWFNNIKRVGILNYLVVALDDNIASFCELNDVPVYKRDSDESFDEIARIGRKHDVSGLKFRVLREFLQLGLLARPPFDHIYRDSDVESMTDGHNNMTSYGFNDVFDEPSMGWGRYVHTMRVWVFNSGFFYIRATIPASELLDRVADRLAKEKAWDQAVFNEELFYPSCPGYKALHASKRVMDYYKFMNSKILFKTPVIVHVNYHPDKLPRTKLAVVDFYVNGNQDALKAFPDGFE
ncbi:hypothetical protein MKX03_036995 [Papaver bracteatum]|nr:hypothetical protein MKX03_036995 [Papaver bracteatum]